MESLRPEQLLSITLAEVYRRRVAVVICLISVSLGALLVGSILPKTYTSSATVLAERREILSPLMEGGAVAMAEQVNDQDRLRLYQELLFSREIMKQIVVDLGLIEPGSSDIALEERLIGRITERTKLEATGPNLVKITVEDQGAEGAFETARLFSEMLVNESEGDKTRESTEAFEFIDRQAKEYHRKLVEAESRLTEHRAENVDIGQGTEIAVAARISGLQTDIERSRLELREARTRKKSLEAQLSGESQVVVRETRLSQYRVQIAELQEQIAALRLQYTETYPDIVNLKYQITDIQRKLDREMAAAESGFQSEATAPGSSMTNPIWQRLRQQLSEVTTEVASLETRLQENERLLRVELDRAKRIPQLEATLAELTRDYEVNNNVYQDLLRRRENARVSMSMDLEQSGGNFRVLFPATLPAVPDGLRLLHFAIAGPLLGLALPIVFIFGSLQVDPRIRHGDQITEQFGFDVLGEIGDILTPAEVRKNRLVNMALGASVAGLAVVYVYVGWLSMARMTANA